MPLLHALILVASLCLTPILEAQSDETSTETTKDSTEPAKPQLKPDASPKIWTYAAGINFIWSRRLDYGARYFYRFEPEISGFMYTALPVERLWLRHGARFGYSSDQPQMPKAVRLEETDWKISLEEGLIYNWFISPSLTAGLGYDWRTIKVKTAAPVTLNDSRLSTKETFLWSYIQVGFGVPALAGKYMFEPVVRWQHLASDARTSWAYGLEASAAW